MRKKPHCWHVHCRKSFKDESSPSHFRTNNWVDFPKLSRFLLLSLNLHIGFKFKTWIWIIVVLLFFCCCLEDIILHWLQRICFVCFPNGIHLNMSSAEKKWQWLLWSTFRNKYFLGRRYTICNPHNSESQGGHSIQRKVSYNIMYATCVTDTFSSL